MYLKSLQSPEYREASELYLKIMSDRGFGELSDAEQQKAIGPVAELLKKLGIDPEKQSGQQEIENIEKTLDYIADGLSKLIADIDTLGLTSAIAGMNENRAHGEPMQSAGFFIHLAYPRNEKNKTQRASAHGLLNNGFLVGMINELIDRDDSTASIILAIGARMLFAKIFGPMFSADGLSRDYANVPSIADNFFKEMPDSLVEEGHLGLFEHALGMMLYGFACELKDRPMHTNDRSFRDSDKKKHADAALEKGRVAIQEYLLEDWQAINKMDINKLSPEKKSDLMFTFLSRFSDYDYPDKIDKMLQDLKIKK